MTTTLRTLLGALLMLSAGLGLAEEGEEHEGRARTPPSPAYSAECGSCHTAFPARLLAAAEWQQITQRLDKHFGVDATLDAKALQQVNHYLQANAADKARTTASGDKLPRITESRWFVREHREVGASVWKRPAIKSAANCSACHGGADQGQFSEHAIRIPR